MNEFDPKELENLLKQMAQVNSQLQAQVGALVRANTVIMPGSEQVDPSKLPELPVPAVTETSKETADTVRTLDRVEQVLSPPPQEAFEKLPLPDVAPPPLDFQQSVEIVTTPQFNPALTQTTNTSIIPPPQEVGNTVLPPIPDLSPVMVGNGDALPVANPVPVVEPPTVALADNRDVLPPEPLAADISPGMQPLAPPEPSFPGMMVNGLFDVQIDIPPVDVSDVSPIVKLDKTTTGTHWEADKMEDVHATLQSYSDQSRRWRKVMLSILESMVDDLRTDATMLESIQRHFELGRRSL
jgi:hypothetical protein